MKPVHRTLAGLAIAAAGLPVLLGLLACLPVPLGDPEKSRIDPEISGMWVMDGEGVVLFEPFDKRTWLVSMVEAVYDEESCGPEQDVESPADEDAYLALVNRIETQGEDCFDADEVGLYKAWRTKLGKRWFMTWEAKGRYDDDHGFASEYWFGFRIEKPDANTMSLRMVDIDFDPFDELEALNAIADLEPPYDKRKLKSARRAVERVIRRNVEDEDLYSSEALEFRRVRAEHYDLFANIVEDVISDMD